MKFGLWWRFALVRGLLWFASTWARRFVGKAGHAAFGAEHYPEQRLADKLGYPMDWEHQTVAAVPAVEAYDTQVGIAKTAVKAALSVVLADDSEARPAALRRIYRLLGTPELANPAYLSDEGMGWLRIAGPNAGWLRRDPAGTFVLDYRALLTQLPLPPGRFLTPCCGRFTPSAAGLDLAEISLVTARGERTLGPADGLAWHLAKLHLQCADLVVHEVVSHFLWTHCHAERIILATTSQLPPGHGLRCLLAPHFAFTLTANENSGRVLLGPNGVFDRLFSCGWQGAQRLMQRGEQEWSFARMVPALDTESRGVASLPAYPYRDDAILVWNALSAHVARQQLALDGPTLAWAADLQRRFSGRLPAVNTPQSLNLLVTACVFATVRHTLANAAQYDSFGYPPHWPSMLRVPFPDEITSVNAEYIQSSLPTLGVSLDAIRATYAFSIQFNQLSAPGADLSAVQAEISRRNRTRTRPYRIAEPARISNSINA